MDSVSRNRLSCYGYDRPTTPNIDAFAEDSTLYKNTIANSSWTVPTHGTLFTGRYPSEHGAHANHKQFDVPAEKTLAGKLSNEGYRTVGLSTNPWIATSFGYDNGFDEFNDIRTPKPFDTKRPRELFQRTNEMNYKGVRKYVEAAKWTLEGNPIARAINLLYHRQQSASYADANVLNNKISTWLDQTDDRPFFMFLNYMDAHEPYNPSEEYLSKFRDGDCSVDIAWHLRSLNETYSDAEIECINDKYDACLNYLDERLGDLFELLKERNIEDETMVILTADHGKCLGEHDYMGVGTFLYDELINIPLIISHPDENKSEERSDFVDQIDIHNMILRSAGIEPELDQQDGTVSETLGPHQNVTVADRKLPEEGLRRINHNGQTSTRDVETNEIIQSSFDSDDTESILAQIEKKYLQRRESIGNETDEKEMDDDVKNQLEQLGYL